ncbi:MAG: hypothetical protein KZQ81_13720 [Candidatus Thiodiazotropha sp. (ex Rostrolucina anterorostrata)]|nr:hypothetical protein [Candidatus Thiodiazotropha sp. (ex Rostrolucina anterorostrata)]
MSVSACSTNKFSADKALMHARWITVTLLAVFVCVSSYKMVEVLVLSYLATVQTESGLLSAGNGIAFCIFGNLVATLVLKKVGRTRAATYFASFSGLILLALLLLFMSSLSPIVLASLVAVVLSATYVLLYFKLNASVFLLDDPVIRERMGKNIQITFLLAQCFSPLLAGWLYDRYGWWMLLVIISCAESGGRIFVAPW